MAPEPMAPDPETALKMARIEENRVKMRNHQRAKRGSAIPPNPIEVASARAAVEVLAAAVVTSPEIAQAERDLRRAERAMATAEGPNPKVRAALEAEVATRRAALAALRERTANERLDALIAASDDPALAAPVLAARAALDDATRALAGARRELASAAIDDPERFADADREARRCAALEARARGDMTRALATFRAAARSSLAARAVAIRAEVAQRTAAAIASATAEDLAARERSAAVAERLTAERSAIADLVRSALAIEGGLCLPLGSPHAPDLLGEVATTVRAALAGRSEPARSWVNPRGFGR